MIIIFLEKESQFIEEQFKTNSVTTIGSNNLLMAFAHVAHDCIVGNDNIFANNAGIAGHVHVGNNVTIGGITTVHQHCKLGDFCFRRYEFVNYNGCPSICKSSF